MTVHLNPWTGHVAIGDLPMERRVERFEVANLWKRRGFDAGELAEGGHWGYRCHDDLETREAYLSVEAEVIEALLEMCGKGKGTSWSYLDDPEN